MSKKGFTLIELMIVIAIISILAVMGITVYSGAQKNARDGKRKADLQALHTAITTSKVPTLGTYSSIGPSSFGSNSVPTDPKTDWSARYCILERTDSTRPQVPTTWNSSTTNCPTPIEGAGTTATPFTATSNNLPASTTTNWLLCAYLENSPTPIYCRSSSL